MTIADQLRRMINDRGFTVAEVAKAAGMTKQQAWALLSGKVPNPRIDTIQRIAEAVGGTIEVVRRKR